MSHGDVSLDLPNFYLKRSKLKEVSTFFSWTKSTTYQVHMEKQKKGKKKQQ